MIITDVGENTDGNALICTTSLLACCNSEASGGSKRGNWILPSKNYIGGPGDGEDFYVTRSSQHQVLLQRRNNALGPLRTYCCMVETVVSSNATICVNGK